MQAVIYHGHSSVVTQDPTNIPIDREPVESGDRATGGVQVAMADAVHPPPPHPGETARAAWAFHWSQALQLLDREAKLLHHIAVNSHGPEGCPHSRPAIAGELGFSTRTLDKAAGCLEDARLIERAYQNGHHVHYRLPPWALRNMMGEPVTPKVGPKAPDRMKRNTRRSRDIAGQAEKLDSGGKREPRFRFNPVQ